MSVALLAANIASAGSASHITDNINSVVKWGSKCATAVELLLETWDDYLRSDEGKELEGKTWEVPGYAEDAIPSYWFKRSLARGMVQVGITMVEKQINAIRYAETPWDRLREVASLVAILDPSGIATVLAAFSFPKCTQYFGKDYVDHMTDEMVWNNSQAAEDFLDAELEEDRERRGYVRHYATFLGIT